MTNPINLYTVSFVGYYPVGAYATIAAIGPAEAKELLLNDLKDKGNLYWFNINMPLTKFNILPGSYKGDPFCYIHSYGDY